MSDLPLVLEQRGAVLVATLRRAPVNALDDALLAALHAALDRAERDEGITLLHLRSDVKAFCAGADLALMRDCFADAEGPDRMTALVARMQQAFRRLETSPVLTLAEDEAAAEAAQAKAGTVVAAVSLADDVATEARTPRLMLDVVNTARGAPSSKGLG